MKKTLKKMLDAITTPFVSVAVLLDESKRIDEDGTWAKARASKTNKNN